MTALEYSTLVYRGKVTPVKVNPTTQESEQGTSSDGSRKAKVKSRLSRVMEMSAIRKMLDFTGITKSNENHFDKEE